MWAGLGASLTSLVDDLAAAEQRVASDLRDARAAGVRGLPTMFIGGERITGAGASVDELAALIARAARS